jgi:osmotically-inducible protein OsmY
MKQPGHTAAPAPQAAPRRRGAGAAQPSDERIHQDICERLAQPFERSDASDLSSERLDAGDVTVSVECGRVILDGTVPERRMKHYIEELVDACPGVQDIDNRLRVRR